MLSVQKVIGSYKSAMNNNTPSRRPTKTEDTSANNYKDSFESLLREKMRKKMKTA
ncbi:MAG: hypothetical protein K2Q26_07525 [Bdellovibrionales bacterium]|nr:hypothetical protein [Bdellovibrionales bacterium]